MHFEYENQTAKYHLAAFESQPRAAGRRVSGEKSFSVQARAMMTEFAVGHRSDLSSTAFCRRQGRTAYFLRGIFFFAFFTGAFLAGAFFASAFSALAGFLSPALPFFPGGTTGSGAFFLTRVGSVK